MSTNLIITPFVKTSRNFPTDPQALSIENNRAYVDLANAVNDRVIGLFPTNRSANNGESWYLSGNKRQQGFRQAYTFTAAGNIPHGLNFASINQFSKPTGSFTDGTNWYGLFYASNVAIAGQVTFFITPTNIVILVGAGAPAIVSGTINLEWLSNI